MLSKFTSWIQKVVEKMLGREAIVERLGLDATALSIEMSHAIDLWFKVFEGRAPWLDSKTNSIRLDVFSTAHISRLVNAELKIEISGSPRGDYLNEQMQRYVLPNITEKTQLAEVGGQVILKPFVMGKDIAVEFVRADCFCPIVVDITGRTTAGVFFDRCTYNGQEYLRTEYHRLDGTQYTIQNKSFTLNGDQPGKEVPLEMVPGWKQLQPETVIQNVERPLFSCFRMPYANNIDLDSPLPVSMFANSLTVMEKIDQIYSGYCWEFESAKRKVYVDEMAFVKDEVTGRPQYPNADLYVGMKIGGDITKFFEDYSPEIREAAYQAGINQQLRIYEAQTGVSSGTYSLDLRTGTITATEVISQDRNTFYTVKAIQAAGKTALEDLIYAMDIYATLYHLSPQGSFETVIEYGDSVFEDTQTEFLRQMQMVGIGLKPELVIAWYFGVSEEDAKKMLGPMTQLVEGGI